MPFDLHILRRLLWRALYRRISLEPVLVAQLPAGQDIPEPLLWEPVSIDGRAVSAVRVEALASLCCRVRVPAKAILVVRCRTTSTEWKVRVEARIDGDDGRHVGRSRADVSSAWKTLVTPISTPGVVGVRLEACGNGADLQNRFTVWAGPEILTRRRAGDVRRRFVTALRHYGLRGSVARLKTRTGGLARQSYDEWISRQTPTADALAAMRREAERLEYKPAIAVLLRSRRDGHALRRSCASLMAQAYPFWEAWAYQEVGSVVLDPAFARDPRFFVLPPGTSLASLRNAALTGTGAAFVACLDAPDELEPHALYEFAKAIDHDSDVDVLYCDEDLTGLNGRTGDFKPGWSPEYLLSRNYLGRLTAIRVSLLEEVGGYSERAGEALDYDAALRVTARSSRVRHVPKVLHHRHTVPAASLVDDERCTLQRFCAESGRAATIVSAGPQIWRVKHHLSQSPRVTLVIPTNAKTAAAPSGGEALVTQCVRSVLERTTYRNFDLLLVDNGHLPDELLELLREVPHERATYSWTGAFNFSRKVNYAVGRVSAEYLLLLNDDIEVISPEWLQSMLEYGIQPEIGAVGAKLYYPDGRLQHVGVVTGVCGIAAHLLHQHPATTTGCGGIALATRNCSAVTGACLLTRRQLFEEVGGFDERLLVDFNDVDFCLRLRRAGYRIVFTPHARLFHHESATFGARAQSQADTRQMRQTWGSILESDPYYNSNLTRDFPDCRLAGY